MLLRIPESLHAERSRAFARASTPARWVDGNVTSGHQSAQAKYNEQLPEESAEAREIGEEIVAALGEEPAVLFRGAAEAGLSAAVQPLPGRT